MTTGHVVLGLLSRGPQHGYELKHGHDSLLPAARALAFGQVYAALSRLRDRGFVEEFAVEKADGPERVRYRITDAGRAELTTWLSTSEAPPEHAANPVATRVALALLSGGRDAAIEVLRDARRVRVDRMRAITRDQSSRRSGLQRQLAAEHTLAHIDADLRWIDAARRRIDDLEGELP
ncbi:MAG: PadR family transcriptional regulator [Dermatophilaceae bacterium]